MQPLPFSSGLPQSAGCRGVARRSRHRDLCLGGAWFKREGDGGQAGRKDRGACLDFAVGGGRRRDGWCGGGQGVPSRPLHPYIPFRALTLATRSWKPWAHRLGTSSPTISIFLPP